MKVEPEALRRLDHRARTVFGLFAKEETITAPDVAGELGLSERMARNLLVDWVKDGWLEVTNPSRRARAYGLSAAYRQYLENRGRKGDDCSISPFQSLHPKAFFPFGASKAAIRWIIVIDVIFQAAKPRQTVFFLFQDRLPPPGGPSSCPIPSAGAQIIRTLSQMKTELVWDGKYDEYGRRRSADVAGAATPMQKIETVDMPRCEALASVQSMPGNASLSVQIGHSSHAL